MRAALLTGIVLASLVCGCLTNQQECEIECWKLDSEGLNDILSNPGALDVLTLSEDNDRLRITTLTEVYSSTDGQQGSIRWNVAKDDVLERSQISMAISMQGTQLDTSEVVAGNKTNIRVGSAWFQGRDASPEYVDPFVLLALQSNADPLGTYPPFGFDPSVFSGMDWTITADPTSTQQIATSENEEISVILELSGDPPAIIGVQMYDLEVSSSFRLDIELGEGVAIEVRDDIPRIPTSIVFPPQPYLIGNVTEWTTVVPPGFILEVRPDEIEIIGLITNNETLVPGVSFLLSEGPMNITDDRGSWWDMEWYDSNGDGLLSSGDRVTLRTDAEGTIGAGIWDLWAEAWAGTVFQ